MTVATRTLTVQVLVALAEELDALADLLERPPQRIVKKALIAYLTREKETRRLIQEGLDDVTAGRMVSMEDAQAWADSLGTENERAVPCAFADAPTPIALLACEIPDGTVICSSGANAGFQRQFVARYFGSSSGILLIVAPLKWRTDAIVALEVESLETVYDPRPVVGGATGCRADPDACCSTDFTSCSSEEDVLASGLDAPNFASFVDWSLRAVAVDRSGFEWLEDTLAGFMGQILDRLQKYSRGGTHDVFEDRNTSCDEWLAKFDRTRSLGGCPKFVASLTGTGGRMNTMVLSLQSQLRA